MVSFSEVWSWNEFEGFVVLSTARLKDDVNFFIRECLEVFHLPSGCIVALETLWEAFLRSFSSKCFQLLGIKPLIRLYMFYG